MAGITLAQAQAKLDLWMAAEDDLARNQSYSMPDGRTLTRADLATIGDRIDYWQSKVDSLSGTTSGRRVRQAAVR